MKLESVFSLLHLINYSEKLDHPLIMAFNEIVDAIEGYAIENNFDNILVESKELKESFDKRLTSDTNIEIVTKKIHSLDVALYQRTKEIQF